MQPALFCSVLLLASACASTPTLTWESDTPRRTVQARVQVEPFAGVRESSEADLNEGNPSESDPASTAGFVYADLLAVDPDLLASAVGDSASGLVAFVCPRESAHTLRDRLREHEDDVDLVGRAGLSPGNGMATWRKVEQMAFVSSFEVVSDGPLTTADPSVSVAEEGLTLNLFSHTSGDGTDLEVHMDLRELDRPFGFREVSALAQDSPLTVQTPTGLARSLRTEALLGDGEVLVVGGGAMSMRFGGRVLLAFFETGL